ncbi:MAG: toprim domain-containing protein, partial [Deltaproteobacteria bacterium]|nr:toprim domain-containing protein [Deltaproteobacteria bacterium]
RHLRQKGFREEDMISCSLATASARDGRALDFLRGRVTIPIRDQHGRVIGFGGRTMDGAQPKYLNSRETALFDKSHTLFGFDAARTAMRSRGRAIVVEGYMDTLQLWQSGFPEAVACLGTAFTSAQLKLMKAATAAVVLLFDGDSAGQKATLSAVRVALSVPEIQVKAAVLPPGEDPDSFVRTHGAEALQKLLDSSVELLDFAVRERLRAVPPLQVPEVVAKEFVPWLTQIPERIQRSFLLTRIAHLTGIDAHVIAGQIPNEPGGSREIRPLAGDTATGPGASATKAPREVPLPPLDRASIDLFGHVFHAQPSECDLQTIKQEVTAKLDLGVEHAALLDEMMGFLAQGLTPSAQPPHAWQSVYHPELQALVDQLRRSAKAFVCDNRRDRFKQLFVVMEQKKQRELVAQLKAEMSRASRDPARRHEVTEILMTIQELTKSSRTTQVGRG